MLITARLTMLVSYRRNLQLKALGASLLISIILFLFLFFRLNISLFGIKIPHIQPEEQQRQPQQPTPTRVIWQPQQSGYQSPQSSTQQIHQTASQQASQTPSQTTPTHDHASQQQTTDTTPDTQTQSTPPPQEPPQQQDAPQSTPQKEAQQSSASQQRASQRPSRVPQKPPEPAPDQYQQETQKTLAQERRRRTNRSKWYKQPHTTTSSRSQSESHPHQSKRQALCHAVKKQAQEKHLASAHPTASGDVYGTSHASENATAIAYETFAGKSDMAIVRSSHQMQYYVYTAQHIRSTMQVTYTSNRNGALEHLAVTTSSGNDAIDNAILNIIRSADLPPLPPEHKEDSITRTITIMIHKAPGSDPVILQINRKQ